jgi:hypothetical protein
MNNINAPSQLSPVLDRMYPGGHTNWPGVVHAVAPSVERATQEERLDWCSYRTQWFSPLHAVPVLSSSYPSGQVNVGSVAHSAAAVVGKAETVANESKSICVVGKERLKASYLKLFLHFLFFL